MGKKRSLLFSAIIFVVASILCNRFIQSRKYPVLFQVYQTSNIVDNWLYKLVGVLPKDFIDSYSFHVIENVDGCTLKKIQRITKVPVEVGYILDMGEKEEFIFSFSYYLVNNNTTLKGINYENHLNFLFDVDVFNKYLRIFEIKNKE